MFTHNMDYRVMEYPADGKWFQRNFPTEKAAMQHAKRRINGREGRLGEIETIHVMRMDSTLIWKWQYGKGITFPDAAELAKHATGDDNA